jgi:hypothetical protein
LDVEILSVISFHYQANYSGYNKSDKESETKKKELLKLFQFFFHLKPSFPLKIKREKKIESWMKLDL